MVQPNSNSEEQRSAVRQDERDRRVHILGVGNIGKLLAHSLATVSDRPAIVLMLHRPALVEIWNREGQSIEIITNGVSNKQTGFEIEAIHDFAEAIKPGGPQNPRSDSSQDVIFNLVIGTKTTQTVAALSAIKGRLTQDSTILFTQNGMGTIDEVNAMVFQDSRTRPKYMTAIVSHGIFSRGPFSCIYGGFGTMNIGCVPHPPPSSLSPLVKGNSRQSSSLASTEYLPNLFAQVPVLAATVVRPPELMEIQFEKLIINAMINPLTVIFDCRNGKLFSNFKILRLMRSLLSEASHVIRSLPELQRVPGMEARFSEESLDKIVLGVAEKTSKNISSMLQDVRAGRETEIDYINGYIVKRGQQLGIDCVYNRTLVRMVTDKVKISDAEIDTSFPHRHPLV
ncbi:MAG: hypothetical protein LQ347_004588 [Umbilicaria vellea]|nr:MAG: hypothetical protein LQ347_004588 [Umbilicaria vellea]